MRQERRGQEQHHEPLLAITATSAKNRGCDPSTDFASEFTSWSKLVVAVHAAKHCASTSGSMALALLESSEFDFVYR